ncbi:toxin-antitoxin system YwqK family antitoxin [Lacinutrix jangbogonensis]|uniref:toxin-antitoxin system YwqK family antitoxin n=1 Tax=Lacinutrix jangbogonensis TaxID=1469557 RepID=UPI00053E30C3|nr:protein translocase component YidC [Lacinutrix jangbogonensis]
MKKLIIVILALVSTLTFAQDINKKDSNGNRHGKWSKNFEGTNVIRYEGEFNHGREVGTFKFYKKIDDKPVLTATRAFSSKNDLAKVKFFSSTKNLISVGDMRGKTYVGKWIYFHNKSKVVMTEEFFDNRGKLEGSKKTYYLSGQLAQQDNYSSGILVGESRSYSEFGKVLRTFNYLNGQLHGSSKVFDSQGRIEMEGVYQKDRRHGIWKFYKDGKFVKEKDFTRRSKYPKRKKK